MVMHAASTGMLTTSRRPVKYIAQLNSVMRGALAMCRVHMKFIPPKMLASPARCRAMINMSMACPPMTDSGT